MSIYFGIITNICATECDVVQVCREGDFLGVPLMQIFTDLPEVGQEGQLV